MYEFIQWLLLMGCEVEVTQEDDGSGYICVLVTPPGGNQTQLTIS